MNSIVKNKNHKKLVITLSVVAIALIASTTVLILASRGKSTIVDAGASVNTAPPTTEQQNAGKQVKSATIDSSPTKGSDSTSDTTDAATSVSITTTSSSQNGSLYQMRFVINSVVSAGTCTLTLTKDSATVTKTSTTEALAQSSTCKGFDIPTSELGAGSWTYTIKASGTDYSGSSNGTIEIQ